MPQILPVLLGGDANVYGMARSFYETYGVRSLAVCRRALPALAHSRIVQVAAQDPAFERDSVFILCSAFHRNSAARKFLQYISQRQFLQVIERIPILVFVVLNPRGNA